MIVSFEDIIKDILLAEPKTRAEFDRAKKTVSGKYHCSTPPNRDLLKAYQNLVEKKSVEQNDIFERFLNKAGVRSNSGIAVITSLLKPYACPGKCIYCPTEVRMPKSYIASEPAAARSLRLNFNPYLLMQKRIEMLESNGHATDKIEYITKGGTWNAYPLKYQYWYMLESFKACNNFSRSTIVSPTQEEDWKDKTMTELQEALEKEQRYNENADHRIIGITFETRPDAISPKTIYHMRKQGCTRVELGLQAPDDVILNLVKRGHTVDDFRKAILLLREAGFKVDLHFMPDLPGTTPQHDVEMYALLFSDPALKPDMVKIYPNTVIKSAELYQWFLDGRYTSYGDESLFDALLQMKLATPCYCRISRLIRDIPATEIENGNTTTNLRELLSEKLKKDGQTCICLRCREIHRQKDVVAADEDPQLFVEQYETIGGTEYFLTFEDKKRKAVYGFLRLRVPHIPPQSSTQKIDSVQSSQAIGTFLSTSKYREQLHTLLPATKDTAFVRELHVYGQVVKIGSRNEVATQHKGYGKRLMAEAEAIAKANGLQKIAVISGVGVRKYYEKLGYVLEDTYMTKRIES